MSSFKHTKTPHTRFSPLPQVRIAGRDEHKRHAQRILPWFDRVDGQGEGKRQDQKGQAAREGTGSIAIFTGNDAVAIPKTRSLNSWRFCPKPAIITCINQGV